jgi:mannose-1-phosphate guanylyltransferase / phosphomannomutase
LQFGVVITDKEGRITKFLEKPGWGEVFSDTINTGIYVLEPEVLELIPAGENRDWSKDVFPRMLAENAPLFRLPALRLLGRHRQHRRLPRSRPRHHPP